MEIINREGIIVTRLHEILSHTDTEKKGQGGKYLAGPYMSAHVDLSLSFFTPPSFIKTVISCDFGSSVII